MQIKHVISDLKGRNGNDEVIIAYWDKPWFVAMTGVEITDDQWYDIVLDGDSVIENLNIGDYLVDAAKYIVERKTVDADGL
jgi:hypothetical protein